jgi:hypothetical protein
MKLFSKLALSLMLLGIFALPACGGKAGDSGTAADGTKAEGEKMTEIAKIEGFKGYDNAEYTFQYPETWTLDEKKEGSIQIKLMNPVTEEAVAPGLASINLVKEDLQGQTLTLDQYLDMSLNNLKKQMESVSIATKTEKKVNGRTCKEVVYSFNMEGMEMKLVQRLYIVGGNGWVVTYGGVVMDGSDFYESFLAEGTKIIDSWGFK